jgi:hypothetical protein
LEVVRLELELETPRFVAHGHLCVDVRLVEFGERDIGCSVRVGRPHVLTAAPEVGSGRGLAGELNIEVFAIQVPADAQMRLGSLPSGSSVLAFAGTGSGHRGQGNEEKNLVSGVHGERGVG